MNIQKFQRSSVFAKNHKLHASCFMSTQGASRAGFFFSAHCRCVRCFFGQRAYAGFFSCPICTSRIYSAYMYIFFKTTQPLTPPPLHHLRNGWPHRPWKACVLFPTSHISFVTQHTLHVSVTGNIFRSDARYLHKELCHLYRINENKY